MALIGYYVASYNLGYDLVKEASSYLQHLREDYSLSALQLRCMPPDRPVRNSCAARRFPWPCQSKPRKKLVGTVTEPRDIPALSLFLGFGATAWVARWRRHFRARPRPPDGPASRNIVVRWDSRPAFPCRRAKRAEFPNPWRGGCQPDRGVDVVFSGWRRFAWAFRIQRRCRSLRPSLLLLLLGYTSVIPSTLLPRAVSKPRRFSGGSGLHKCCCPSLALASCSRCRLAACADPGMDF